MNLVEVYFYNNNMYNLEDMSLIGTYPLGNLKILYEHLKLVKQEYNIKLAIMDFNHPLRNALYTMFPNVAIVIHPLDVMQMIQKYLGSISSNDLEEEVAAGIEDQVLIAQQVEISCYNLYSNKTKQEAIADYEEWQGNVPIGIKCFHHVIRTIDYYHEEVFNYFEFKNIFKQTMP